jgi:putative thioredoxin
MDTSTFDFQTSVIEQSHRIPVLVDFWAEWCGPCRILAPVLERMASKNEGKWALVKINTEEFPDIATMYGVRGIPNVKLFIGGEVSDEFTGALPEYQIEQWLKKALPSPFTALIDRAAEDTRKGNFAEAIELLEDVLKQEPDNSRVKSMLIRLILFSRPADAARLSESLEGQPEYSEFCDSVRTMTALLRLKPGSLPEAEVRDRYISAIASLRNQDFDGALDVFIDVLRDNRYYDDDGSRKACIAIFRFLGEDHEITLKHRRSFDRAF